jgi:phytol kinase
MREANLYINNNLSGILVSFGFVFLVLLISTLAVKVNKKVDVEISRKIVHIGVANWWWIAMYFFDSPLWASIPPIFFVVFNVISVKVQLVKSMERETAGYGTVFYPVSLLILSIFCFSGLSQPYIGAIAVSCMGYGDGFAAVIGNKFGKHKFRLFSAQKSLEGCIAMFVLSFVSSAAILWYNNISYTFIIAIFIAAVSTLLEMFTPNGYDNLTVPLGVGLFAYAIL